MTQSVPETGSIVAECGCLFAGLQSGDRTHHERNTSTQKSDVPWQLTIRWRSTSRPCHCLLRKRPVESLRTRTGSVWYHPWNSAVFIRRVIVRSHRLASLRRYAMQPYFVVTTDYSRGAAPRRNHESSKIALGHLTNASWGEMPHTLDPRCYGALVCVSVYCYSSSCTVTTMARTDVFKAAVASDFRRWWNAM